MEPEMLEFRSSKQGERTYWDGTLQTQFLTRPQSRLEVFVGRPVPKKRLIGHRYGQSPSWRDLFFALSRSLHCGSPLPGLENSHSRWFGFRVCVRIANQSLRSNTFENPPHPRAPPILNSGIDLSSSEMTCRRNPIEEQIVTMTLSIPFLELIKINIAFIYYYHLPFGF
jgi:hypothetical protein